ncbi:MAG TPA: hypothetical protein VIG32_00095 [Candidatus Baltobacteraceae bacterium]
MNLNRSGGLALVLAAALLAGCSHPVDVNAPDVRGIGYVRLDEVVKAHPLYGQLAQLDNAMSALSLASLGPAVPKTGAQIAAETTQLNAELKAAQDRANSILQKKQVDYGRREQAAIRAALVAAGEAGAGSQAGAQMQQTSNVQAAQVTAQANADFAAYQQSVLAQDRAAVAAIDKQLSTRADRQYRQKATQLQERESQLSLQLSQQDANRRLELRTKLSNLALDDATRKTYRDQLDALDRHEASALGAQRSADARELAAYQAQLRKQTGAEIAQQAAKIHAQTRTLLASRRNQVGSQITTQLKGLAPQAAVPANVSPQTRTKLAAIDKQFKAQFQADAQQTVARYQQTKADLDARYAALHGVDASAATEAGSQMSALRKQRDDLYGKIVDQIKHEAAAIAVKRGLRVVFVSPSAASGGLDLTDDVTKDIESLHQ